MKKYIHKPTEVEAFFYTGESKSYQELKSTIKDKPISVDGIETGFETGLISAHLRFHDKKKTTIFIRPKTWIIFGINGSIYPTSDENFKAIYDEKKLG